MSSTWRLIELALNEGSGKDSLLAHIRFTQGDHEADNLAPFLDAMWNKQQLPVLAKHLLNRYADPKVNAIFDKEMTKMGIAGNQSSKPAVMKRDADGKTKSIATSKPPAKAGKKQDEPMPTQFRTPDQMKAAQAATAATAGSRPDRAGTKTNTPSRPPVMLKPGERPVHDVGQSVRGTSPGHTKQPIDQPSVVMQPSKLAGQLKPLQDRAKQLQKMITLDLQNDPTKKVQLAKAKQDLQSLQQKIDSIKNVGSSGVEDAQRRVDQLTKAYGKTAPHIPDDLARKLGVPTTRQRTTKSVDPESGKETQQVQVWNQEKVYRFMNKGAVSQGSSLRIDPEVEPGIYDAPPAANPLRPNAMQGQDMPVHDMGKGKAASNKPMMKAPKGLDKDGLARLSNLKLQLKKAKGTPDEQKIKSQVDQMMSSGGEIIDVVRPGSKPGMRWGDMVWDGTDWALDSQKAAAAGAAVSKSDD